MGLVKGGAVQLLPEYVLHIHIYTDMYIRTCIYTHIDTNIYVHTNTYLRSLQFQQWAMLRAVQRNYFPDSFHASSLWVKIYSFAMARDRSKKFDNSGTQVGVCVYVYVYFYVFVHMCIYTCCHGVRLL